MKKTRLFSLLAAVWMAVAGAVAQTETLLTTITPDGSGNPQYSVAGMATLDKGGAVYNNGMWFGTSAITPTVTAEEGVTITRVVFTTNKTTWTDTEAPFSIKLSMMKVYNPDTNESIDGTGVNKIEVYGYEGYAAPADPVAIASVTHTPEEAEGTVAITYGADGTTLTPGETLLSDVKGQKVTVAVTPKAGYRVVGVTLENVADEPAPDMTATPLTLLVTKAGNLAFYSNDAVGNLKYKVNGGEAQSATKGGTIEGLKVGDVVAFYCGSTQTSMGNDEIFAESNTTIEAQVYGNVMSLLDGENFATAAAVGTTAFMYLFYSDAFLSNHPTNDLVLPATTLAEGCYYYMFNGCTGLTRTPKLPATTLARLCYSEMFYGCEGLTDAYVAAPYTMSNYEMDGMFTSITAGQCTMHTTADAQSSWSTQTAFSLKEVKTDF